MRQEIPALTPISSAQKKRLLAAGIVFLAVAIFGLATRAKTSHYAAGSKSATYFSSSVKVAQKAHTLRTLLAAPVIAGSGLPPVVATIFPSLPAVPALQILLEPLAAVRPSRAPPAFLCL
jgi:hypothetical protein